MTERQKIEIYMYHKTAPSPLDLYAEEQTGVNNILYKGNNISVSKSNNHTT